MYDTINLKSAVAALLLVPLAATAGELLVHGASWHGEKEYHTGEWKTTGIDWNYYARTGQFGYTYAKVMRPYNNTNTGLGYLFDSGWAIGAYRNSYYATSAYVSYTKDWQVLGPVRLGLSGILATGYSGQTGNAIQPAVALTASYQLTDGITLRVLGAPRVGDGAAVAHFFVSYRLQR